MHPVPFICRSYDVFLLYTVSCYFETRFQECYIISLHFRSFNNVLCRGKSLLLNMASNMISIPFCVEHPAELSQTMLVLITKAVTLLHTSISINDTLHHRRFCYFMICITFSCIFSCVLWTNKFLVAGWCRLKNLIIWCHLEVDTALGAFLMMMM